MTAPLPDDLRDRLAAMLSEHTEDYPDGCACHGYPATSLDVFRHRDKWWAHRLDILAPVVAQMLDEREAEAWDEGWRIGASGRTMRNPYRAVLSPDAAPGDDAPHCRERWGICTDPRNPAKSHACKHEPGHPGRHVCYCRSWRARTPDGGESDA